MRDRQSLRLGAIGLLAVLLGMSAAPSPSPTAAAPAATATAAVDVRWTITKRTLEDGRAYFVRAPRCAPAGSPSCDRYLGRKRPLVFFLHAALAVEDRETAASWLQGMGGWSPDTLFVFGLSKDRTKRWDGGICCTSEPVDDVRYLARVVKDVAGRWSVNRRRVGAAGLSNGGMLALRAACDRPHVFGAAVALAGVYDGACDEGPVRIGQWHGANDSTVPLDGGTATILGEERTLPSVASLSQRMLRRSHYQLHVIPGRGHAMTWDDHRRATLWLLRQLPR